ncbi:unnamed protein product [Ilex paraguariensis]|uniref:Uncharacterized protein n=1 Tax=Ilex paraguariensis TaxID=185542 RepID=A0ABC8UKA7_9AQUA
MTRRTNFTLISLATNINATKEPVERDRSVFNLHPNKTVLRIRDNSDKRRGVLCGIPTWALMAVASSDHVTSICPHCDRAIPSSNIDLHYAHCSRNLEKCKVCGDMVPKKYAEEHFLGTHAPVCEILL